MSIGNVGGPNDPTFSNFYSQGPQSPQVILQSYTHIYTDFVNDPSATTAHNFLMFLEANKQTLSQFAIYPPYLGETWSRLYDDMVRDLQGFMNNRLPLSAMLETADNMRIMLGVNITPSEILTMFQQAMAAFREDPYDRSASDLIYLYLSTPGYVNALAEASHAGSNFATICSQASQVIGQFRNGKESEQAALFALETVANALGKAIS